MDGPQEAVTTVVLALKQIESGLAELSNLLRGQLVGT